MKIRLFAALLIAIAPVAARAADEENPYKKVKVGEFASYKMTTKIAGMTIEGTVTQTISAKDEKEATVKVTGKINGTDIPAQEQKVDLTKPYDPTKAATQGADAKVEKLKDGKEKIKAAGKEYDCKWESFKVTSKQMGVEMVGEVKVWQSKDLPLQMVKMEMTAEVMGMKFEMEMELSEAGSKAD